MPDLHAEIRNQALQPALGLTKNAVDLTPSRPKIGGTKAICNDSNVSTRETSPATDLDGSYLSLPTSMSSSSSSVQLYVESGDQHDVGICRRRFSKE
jgi:hypothetical protein